MNKYVRILNLLIVTVLFCFAACAKDDSITQITLINNVETCSTLENYLKPNTDDITSVEKGNVMQRFVSQKSYCMVYY